MVIKNFILLRITVNMRPCGGYVASSHLKFLNDIALCILLDTTK
jgi:hypothetical protein